MSLDSSRNKRIVFVGYYVPESLLETIVKQGINNMSTARQELECSILKGLSKNDCCNLKAVSYVPTSSTLVVPAESEIDDLSIFHIPIKKGNLFSWVRGMWLFMKYLNQVAVTGTSILMYAVNPVFMFPLWILKRYKGLTLTTICSEVPSFRRYRNSLPMKLKKRIQTFFNNRFDSYILLTEAMKEVVSIKNKPYMVMEGIASNLPDKPQINKRKNIVMYAGGLHPDNNLKLLIDSCVACQTVDECWICGSGPQEKELRDYSCEYSKIKFLGRLSHQEVLEREKEVKILVNLRDPSNILTRYSFPSKIIEYLSSGAQVISSPLAGIPHEYYDHLNCLKGMDTAELVSHFNNILSLSDDEFYNRASKALIFLKNHKSAKAQTQRIVDFICQSK